MVTEREDWIDGRPRAHGHKEYGLPSISDTLNYSRNEIT
jgi:hypothetical protein